MSTTRMIPPAPLQRTIPQNEEEYVESLIEEANIEALKLALPTVNLDLLDPYPHIKLGIIELIDLLIKYIGLDEGDWEELMETFIHDEVEEFTEFHEYLFSLKNNFDPQEVTNFLAEMLILAYISNSQKIINYLLQYIDASIVNQIDPEELISLFNELFMEGTLPNVIERLSGTIMDPNVIARVLTLMLFPYIEINDVENINKLISLGADPRLLQQMEEEFEEMTL